MSVMGALLVAGLIVSVELGRQPNLVASSICYTNCHPKPLKAMLQLDSGGTVYALGNAHTEHLVSVTPRLMTTASPHVVGIASTPSGLGYWVAFSNGQVNNYGDAPKLGELPSQLAKEHLKLNQPIIAIAAAGPRGYYLAGADGGVFPEGTARFYGSLPERIFFKHLRGPIVGIAATNNNGGYWLFASDGGVFNFGDAHFYGSIYHQLKTRHLHAPVVGGISVPGSNGYRLVARDGGVFNFGNRFYGSLHSANVHTNSPTVALVSSSTGLGYWVVTANGHTYKFGDAPSLGSSHPAAAIVSATN